MNFEVIISSDNAALEFLLQNHQRLFPQTPVVFCGVGRIERYDFSKQPLFTGIVEVTDNTETVALALRLQPGGPPSGCSHRQWTGAQGSPERIG